MTRALRRQAMLIIGVLSAAYLVSQFYRTSVAVIAPALKAEIGLGPEGLGIVTGIFFLAIAVLQIPAGVFYDRFGPRRTNSCMLLVAALGSLGFASAYDLTTLAVARLVMGAGWAGLMTGALVVGSRWFPADRFATLAAVLLGVGQVGNLMSTAPLAYASQAFGWRATFVVMAAVTLVAAGAIYAFVRDAPPGHPYHGTNRGTLGQTVRGLGEVLVDRRLHRILALSLVSYSVPMTVFSLWGGPFLHDVYGLDAVGIGSILFWMSLTMTVGAFACGPLDRLFDTRRGVVLAGAAATSVLLVALALLPADRLLAATVLLAGIGLVSGYHIVVMAHNRALWPDRMVGRGTTVVGAAVFLGIALMQFLTGLMIGAFAGPDGSAPHLAYTLVFLALAAATAVGAGFYSTLPDARPSAGFVVDRQPAKG